MTLLLALLLGGASSLPAPPAPQAQGAATQAGAQPSAGPAPAQGTGSAAPAPQAPAVPPSAPAPSGNAAPGNAAPGNVPSGDAAPGTVERPDDLLALPRGRSTVMGGLVTRLDPVSDSFTLRIYGGKSMKILYDARTQIFRDGQRASLDGLREHERASVETMLDGDRVFARSIHILSQTPEGEFQGQVTSFDAAAGALTVNEPLSSQPIHLTVPAGVPIVRRGQAGSRAGSPSDLVRGALITATFQPDSKGQGVVRSLTVLAVPGEQLTFTGTVTYLNLRQNQLALTDEGNGQNYTIHFSPESQASPESQGSPESQAAARQIRDGSRVRVRAQFDGTRYQALSIEPLS